eukprot:XP_001693535.1 predicted protein [Chlamydomonas reinhardtii]
MASLPQLQPDAAMAHAAVSSQPLQPQPTAALALSSALSAGALTPVQQASVPLQSGQLPLLVAAGGSAASGSGVGSDTGIPRTPASSNGVVDGTGSSAGTGAVGNSPRLASAGVPVASESDSRTLLAEYWFRVGKLQGQQAQVLSEMDRLEKIAQRASGDVAANSRRSRRLLVEVYKRCRVEPGSAEAANYPICGNVVKLMRAADECLIKFIATKASARAAAAAPSPGLPEGGAAEPPPAFVCPITQCYQGMAGAAGAPAPAAAAPEAAARATAATAAAAAPAAGAAGHAADRLAPASRRGLTYACDLEAWRAAADKRGALTGRGHA